MFATEVRRLYYIQFFRDARRTFEGVSKLEVSWSVGSEAVPVLFLLIRTKIGVLLRQTRRFRRQKYVERIKKFQTKLSYNTKLLIIVLVAASQIMQPALHDL